MDGQMQDNQTYRLGHREHQKDPNEIDNPKAKQNNIMIYQYREKSKPYSILWRKELTRGPVLMSVYLVNVPENT